VVVSVVLALAALALLHLSIITLGRLAYFHLLGDKLAAMEQHRSQLFCPAVQLAQVELTAPVHL
jgi:hypothetical protein